MMAAYLIAEVEVTDAETFAQYRAQAGGTAAPYGGKPLVVDGRIEHLEGRWQPKQLVVLEFENMEQARRWYESAEYQQAIPLRQRSSTSSLLLVEGLPVPAAPPA